MKNLTLFLLAIFTIFSCSSRDNDDNGSDTDNSAITGSWIAKNSGNEFYTLKFESQGTIKYNLYSQPSYMKEGTYTFKNGVLKITNTDPAYSYTQNATIEGNTLKIIFTDGTDEYTKN